MPQYLIYGKRTKAIRNTKTGEMMGPDSRFAALDWQGKRVSRKEEAFAYATKEDAQERIDSIKPKDGVLLEIRPA